MKRVPALYVAVADVLGELDAEPSELDLDDEGTVLNLRRTPAELDPEDGA